MTAKAEAGVEVNARVVSGAYKGRRGILQPGYPGLWIHIVFQDKGKPTEAYLPKSAVIMGEDSNYYYHG